MMDYAALQSFRSALEKAPHLVDLKAICREFCAALGVDPLLAYCFTRTAPVLWSELDGLDALWAN